MNAQIKTILVPLDFSENARSTLREAAELAARFDAQITVMHVVDTLPYEIYLRQGLSWGFPHEVTPEQRTLSNPESEWAGFIGAVENNLTALARETGGGCETLVRQGDPVEEILRTIEERRPDLVVMCTHGWHGLRHAMLGSVTEKVIRKSPVPVLTLRTGEQKAA